MQITSSPFVAHRDKILGHYGTAAFLRKLVLAMWNGNAHPTGLHQIACLDQDHRQAALDMIEHFSRHGEADKSFMALADECRARIKDDF